MELPNLCQKCDALKRWIEADEEERLKIEEEYNFDCGACDYALDRWG